jgi:hypothetical protein
MNMKRRVIRKWFWAWEFDKEEAWLNEMAQRGWVLDKIDFAKFTFVECEKGEYTVRLEMLENAPSSAEGQDYIDFVEETGAEYIGNMLKWVYFRKKTADGEFDLFSDIASRIKNLDNIMRPLGAIGAANLLIGISNLNLNGVGWINIACAALLGYACLKLSKKKEQLQKERTLHE